MPLPYTKLNPNAQKSKGEGNARFAPHKPLLLLCLIDMATDGELDPPLLFKSPGLRLRFDSYYAICQPRWKNAITLDLPFHHLSSQGFWNTLTKEGTPSKGERSTHHVELNSELVEDLSDSSRRDQIRRTLVESWFPVAEQQALYAAFGWSSTKLRQIEWNDAVNEDAEATGRNANFRVKVVTQYRFTCALTGTAYTPRKVTLSSKQRTSMPFTRARTTTRTMASLSAEMPTGCSTKVCGRWTKSTTSWWPMKFSPNGAPKLIGFATAINSPHASTKAPNSDPPMKIYIGIGHRCLIL